jgi:uncharacterized protein
MLILLRGYMNQSIISTNSMLGRYWRSGSLCTGIIFSLLAGNVFATQTDKVSPNIEVMPYKIYGQNDYKVPFRKAMPLTAPRARYTGFSPKTVTLKKWSIRREGAMPLPCDMVLEKDVALTLRDGTKIYTDVFRPTEKGKYPSLVAWSPYGKTIGGQWLDDLHGRSGVPLDKVSELQKFEGPDPAFWVCNGYAVLNPDARGAYESEGNITYWGRQLAEDGYDFVEWTAKQDWSNGKIGLSGNSWLAVSQWFIAAEQPPHLAAIAPWEGFTDHFRDTGNRGGIPAPQFPEMIIQTFAGNNLIEDQPRMIVKEQTMTPYWEDKKAKLQNVNVPAYVVASYTNAAHTHGSFDGFRNIASKEKWLRVNNTNEWEDYYTPKYSHDLLKFFDHYLKGIDNGWEDTPKVRLSVLDTAGEDIVDRTENEWPLARTHFKKLYLNSGSKLTDVENGTPQKLSYSVSGKGETEFTYVFDKETELTGYMSLHMWVEALGSDDMELSVKVEKLGTDGKPASRLLGEGVHAPVSATGLLRVSQRELDPKRSTESEPYLTHTHEELLKKGQIVPIDIGIWPMGMKYHAGEQLKLTVSAYKPMPVIDIGFGAAKIAIPNEKETFMPGEKVSFAELGGTPDTSPKFVKQQEVIIPQSRNKGTHLIHFGGRFDSYLVIPDIPNK